MLENHILFPLLERNYSNSYTFILQKLFPSIGRGHHISKPAFLTLFLPVSISPNPIIQHKNTTSLVASSEKHLFLLLLLVRGPVPHASSMARGTCYRRHLRQGCALHAPAATASATLKNRRSDPNSSPTAELNILSATDPTGLASTSCNRFDREHKLSQILKRLAIHHCQVKLQ